MKRPSWIAGTSGALVLWLLALSPTPGVAQTPGRMYRLGHLANSAISEAATRQITLPELAKLGFIEGQNFTFESRVGEAPALPGLMQELLATKPDAIIAVGTGAILTARAATQNVSIVAFGADPVELKLAQTYARPGGNITGMVILLSELEPKRMSILLEALPERKRVAALVSPAQRPIVEPALKKAAAGLGAELSVFPVSSAADYPAAFAAMRAAGVQSLLIGAATELFRDGKQLAALASEAGLPTMCEWAEMVQMGCMIGYGPSRTALRKRLAVQLASIFRGTPAGDIAIEQPTLYEFGLNLKIAKSLGVSIPQSVLVRADEVIE